MVRMLHERFNPEDGSVYNEGRPFELEIQGS